MAIRQVSDRASAPASLRLLAAGLCAGALAGCLPGGADDIAARAPEAAPGLPLLGSDVETPEVFSTRDRALWDGRPSLGGIWVAAPDVTAPERVLIRVPGSGKSVIGALFRREREFAGPPLQLSSEAANALGIYAGMPTEVEVVALRRAEAPDISAALPPPPASEAAARVEPATVTVDPPAAAPAPRGTIFGRLFRRDPAARAASVPVP